MTVFYNGKPSSAPSDCLASDGLKPGRALPEVTGVGSDKDA